MAECPHDWQRKPDSVKERCTICGAGRLYDETRCNHQYVPVKGIAKERCSLCGASRATLDVQDVVQPQITPEVK